MIHLTKLSWKRPFKQIKIEEIKNNKQIKILYFSNIFALL